LRARSWIVGSLIATLSSGCTLNAAPPKWLPTASETAVYGGWIRLEVQSEGGGAPVEGELLALNADSVWVLTAVETRAVPRARVRKGSLTAYDPEAGHLATWTLLGTLGTASHGVISAITAPLWVLTGSLATASQARSARLERPPRDWADLARYARFPQGPPPGLDLRAIRR
jgi:hypothetical protein